MPPQLLVFIVANETLAGDAHIHRLQELFKDPVYEVHIIRPLKLQHKANECKLFQYALKLSLKHSGLLPCLLIRDSSICIHTAAELKSKLLYLLSLDYDMVYLTTQQEQCHRQRIVHDSAQIKIKTVVTPTASQALLISRRAQQVIMPALNKPALVGQILNTLIAKHKLHAVTMVPHMFEYDSDLATSNDHYSRLTRCVEVSDIDTVPETHWIVFAILLLFIVFIAYYLIAG